MVGKYPVITLCGSTRFQEQIRQNAELAAFLEEANRRENNGADLCPFDKTWQGYSLALPPWSPTISEIPKTPSNGQRQPVSNPVAGGAVLPCVAARKDGLSTKMER